MQYVPSTCWPWSIAAYVGAGCAVSLARLDLVAASMGLRSGYGVAVGVNLVLPIIVLVVTFWYPRLRLALWGGMLTFVGGYFVTNLLQTDWHFWAWTRGFVSGRLSPILVAGGLISGLLATAECVVVNRFRIVGDEPQPEPCRSCGYSLEGVPKRRGVCPECGKAI